MQSNYKTLGKSIRKVDNRNRDLQATNLLGINIDKFFMPSVANIVGTDMSAYKVVKKDQFACNRMHVGRDYRLPISLSRSEEDFIVSPAYDVFEIIDTEKLLPEYLMMWFSRKEFDRNAWFYTDADVRGGLNWNALVEMQLPIPSISKQQEIVKEYHTIINRITLNNQLIQKLEETAKAIYKQWFVDFDFPDEVGKPYKSNDGEMEESELGEIPQGWYIKNIRAFCEITSSKRIFESEYRKEGIPFYRAGEIKQKKEGIPVKEVLYISKERYFQVISTSGKPISGDILMTAVGSLLGDSYLVEDEEFYFKDGNVIWFKNFKQKGINFYLYDYFQSQGFSELLNEIKIGSGQSAITIVGLGQKKIILPDVKILEKYAHSSEILNKNISTQKNQNIKLNELKDLLLSKLATIEDLVLEENFATIEN